MLGNPYCGNSPPPSHSQVSSSNQLFIHFRTDTSDTGGGFKLEYNATSKDYYNVDYCRLCPQILASNSCYLESLVP